MSPPISGFQTHIVEVFGWQVINLSYRNPSTSEIIISRSWGQSINLRFSSGNNQNPCPSGRSTSPHRLRLIGICTRSVPTPASSTLSPTDTPLSPQLSSGGVCSLKVPIIYLYNPQSTYLGMSIGAIVITENVQSSGGSQSARGTLRLDEGNDNCRRLHFPVVLTPSNTKTKDTTVRSVEKHSSY